jgi:hypothetical protein
VAIEAPPNPGGQRSATVTIADQKLLVVQEARPSTLPPDAPQPGCTIGLDAGERTFGAAGGDGSIRVMAPSGCSWSALASEGWIEVAGSSGTGTDTVRYHVAPNTSASPRTGTVSVSGRIHTVRQEGAAGGGGEAARIELAGHAFLVEGSCPSITFLLELRRVFTTGETKYRDGNCRDIRTGTEVTVEGRVQADGRVRATDVRIGDDD